MVARTGSKKAPTGIPFKKTVLALSVMAVANAHAQTENSNSTAKQSNSPEEVVVTGIRQNIINAQAMKRDAETFVDAISAEDIGSLPDASVLETLQRIPGIVLDRFAARDDSDHFSSEGSNITLRGLPQTRTSFNGRDSFSATSGRGLSFEDVSKDLLGSVEVVKNQTADMVEGGISGTITLNTRKPFDANGRQLAFSVQGNYGDFAQEVTPEFSGLFSDIFEVDGGEVGFLVSFSEARSTFRADGTELGIHTEFKEDSTRGLPLTERRPLDANGTLIGRDPITGEPVSTPERLAYAPLNAGVRSTVTDRFRRGLATSLQYRSDDSKLETTLEFVRSESRADWTEFAFISDDQGGNTWTAEYDDNGVFQRGLISGAGLSGGANGFGPQTRSKDVRETIQDISLNIRYQATDRLALSVDVQKIKATNNDEDLSVFGGLRSGAVIFADRNGGTPEVQFLAPISSGQTDAEYYSDPTNYFFRAAMDHLEDSEADEEAFQFDLDYDIDQGIFQSVEAGVRFAERNQTTRWSTFNWQNLSEEWNGGQIDFGGTIYNPPWVDGGSAAGQRATPEVVALEVDNFHRGSVGQGFTGLYITPDSVSNYDIYERTFNSEGAFANSGPRLAQRGGTVNGGFYLPVEVNPTIENNQAFYVKLNFGGGDTNRFSGNIGLRYVKQDTRVEGGIQYPTPPNGVPATANSPALSTLDVLDLSFAADDPRRAIYGDIPADAGLAGGTNVQTLGLPDAVQSVDSDFETVLPSLNIKYEITEDLIARFAYSKAISFPDLGALRFNYFISDSYVTPPSDGDPNTQELPIFSGFNQISGNPFLKPMEADNYDLSLEWYFDDDSALTVGIFHKDLTNFFVTNTNNVDAIGPDGESLGFTIPATQPANRDSATLQGLEIGYSHFFKNLPDALDGLGVQFNLSRLWANGVPNQNIRINEFDDVNDVALTVPVFDDLPLEGMSDITFNFVLMYETASISSRLAYNYRSDYLLSQSNVNLKQPVFIDSTATLDGSIFYNVTDYAKIGLQAANITNTETKSRFQVDNEGTKVTRSAFVTDRRLSLVARFNF